MTIPRSTPLAPVTPAATYSRAYLRHLFQSGEILFSILATLHNVWLLP